MGLPVFVGLMALACAPPALVTPVPPDPVAGDRASLRGDNLGGINLGGINLGGINLAGGNLGGINLGGINLGGRNLGGINLGGTNLGGNNLGSNRLSQTALASADLGGSTLAGADLRGLTLAGTALSGSEGPGSQQAGNDVTGTTLDASNLAGPSSGRNIHRLPGAAAGLLYSGEDLRTPRDSRCIVLGAGSTAFGRLLGQQSSKARISVALGKLPWGFAPLPAWPLSLQAWEAVVWGDRSYCVFLLAAPVDATWPGVAGFMKAVFRWQAAPGQQMDIAGIEASAPHDPTLSSAVVTHTGMMDTAALWRAGRLAEREMLAGELAFVTATTNNQSVQVDFASWVLDVGRRGLVLGNVQNVNPPTFAESVYYTVDNGDGTVSVKIWGAYPGSGTGTGIVDSFEDLDLAFANYARGRQAQPTARRCGGALYLQFFWNVPLPAGKCDGGLSWASDGRSAGFRFWSAVPGTTAPMNQYMVLPGDDPLVPYRRGLDDGDLRPVLSETYIHLWEKSFDLPAAACAPEDDRAFCARLGRSCGSVAGTDNCGATRRVQSCGDCPAGTTCGGGGAANVCGSGGARPCKTPFAKRSCSGYLRGSAVSAGGRNWICASGDCAHCADQSTCAPHAGGGCPWGAVWVDDGPCTSPLCTPESDAEFCTRLGKTCGTVTARDSCGSMRTVASCGGCVAPQTCGGGGAASVCGGGGVCPEPYARARCTSYMAGMLVESGGRTFRCLQHTCANCAVAVSCAPGGSGCPWGVVWEELGVCRR